MAAPSSSRRVGSRSSTLAGEDLPSGSCNFRDLSIGVRAPTCGCKRFWLNASHFSGGDGNSERAWCFCGHHACFHSVSMPQRKTQEPEHIVSGNPLNDIVEAHGTSVEHFPRDGAATSRQTFSAPVKEQPSGLGIRSSPRPQSQSINTRVWQALNDFARHQDDGVMSETASKLPSTAAPSVVESDRLSPNRIIQDRLRIYQPMGPPVHIPPTTAPNRQAEEYSATEVATPSVAGTPDFRALASSSSQAGMSPAHLQPGRIQFRTDANEVTPIPKFVLDETVPTQPLLPPTTDNFAMSPRDMQSLLQAFGRRLDVVENLSFSHAPVEEMQERCEVLDGRLIDLEQWRTEQDQPRQSPAPSHSPRIKKRRALPNEQSSFDSDLSFDLNAAAHTEAVVLATLAANAETNPRLDDLDSRVADLENRIAPSFARPWQVQVVLLPWGRDLRGIWFSAEESTQHSVGSMAQTAEEWSLPQSTGPLSFNASFDGTWTTESIEAWANEAHEWLSPKACGPNGMVFRRLASRGLVRMVELTSFDAHHIMSKIKNAFTNSIESEVELTAENAKYHGLTESFIPLRKVRKSSRLRFLSPSELVTSASWTSQFLDSSVMMKVKEDQRRLYITTPDAYTQPARPAFSWQKIRDLPLHDATGDEQAAQANNIAIEACWTYNDALDRAMSFHTTTSASHASQWSIHSQVTEHNNKSNDHQAVSPQADAQLNHRRTFSLPSSHLVSEPAKELIPRRRVASFETGTSVPIDHIDPIIENAAKRRRVSTSPSIERRGVNFTPRWSREPPSPFTSEVAAEARSQGTSSRKRGATPFAYATPHSNSNIVVRLDSIVGDGGDTEADTEMLPARSEHGDDEWHGMDDEGINTTEEAGFSVRLGREEDMDDDDDEGDEGHFDDDVDEDYDEEDDGLTIYLT